jgi:hypothetical protein
VVPLAHLDLEIYSTEWHVQRRENIQHHIALQLTGDCRALR